MLSFFYKELIFIFHLLAELIFFIAFCLVCGVLISVIMPFFLIFFILGFGHFVKKTKLKFAQKLLIAILIYSIYCIFLGVAMTIICWPFFFSSLAKGHLVHDVLAFLNEKEAHCPFGCC